MASLLRVAGDERKKCWCDSWVNLFIKNMQTAAHNFIVPIDCTKTQMHDTDPHYLSQRHGNPLPIQTLSISK